MRKIVPFNNVLTFSTDVCEITAISLEHDIKTDVDSISGIFFISGEYKITDGQLEKEKFNFELPFDIALGREYDLDTLEVDIDDFHYELIDNNKLKVNIELSIDGDEKIIEEPQEEQIDEPSKIDIQEIADREEEITMNEDEHALLDEMLENIEIENNIENENENTNSNNIFNNFTNEEKYVTYRVYRITEGDTLDNILSKYNTTKEELEKYNSDLDIHVGNKLIIPYNDK